jgi:hypothetical protein
MRFLSPEESPGGAPGFAGKTMSIYEGFSKITELPRRAW